MSRSKSVDQENVVPAVDDEVTELPENSLPVEEEKSEGETVTPQDNPQEPKIGVVRFLQLNRQDKMTADLMRSLFKMDLHTESEWFNVRDELLGHKIKR